MLFAMTSEVAAQYGLLGVVLIAIGGAVWRAAAWLAEHVMKPTVSAHIEFLSESVATMRAMREDIGAMNELDEALRASIDEMEVAHSDPNSVFSTVHTNDALRLFADAIMQGASAAELDLSDFRRKIDSILDQQERQAA